jgi:hypothetical protein
MTAPGAGKVTGTGKGKGKGTNKSSVFEEATLATGVV